MRCDICRSPCGTPANPGLVYQHLNHCIQCFTEFLDEYESPTASPYVDWYSSESDSVLTEEEFETDDIETEPTGEAAYEPDEPEEEEDPVLAEQEPEDEPEEPQEEREEPEGEDPVPAEHEPEEESEEPAQPSEPPAKRRRS